MSQPESVLACSRCNNQNPPTAKFCFQCGQSFPSPDLVSVPPPTGLNRAQIAILVIALVGLAVVFLIYGGKEQQGGRNRRTAVSGPATLTSEHRSAIHAALRKIGYPMPADLEINETGFLVATFELRGPVTPLSVKTFAEDSIMVIREAMLPFKIVERYRVTLNGPSPGTGMIRRYGNARLIEGDQVRWEPAE